MEDEGRRSHDGGGHGKKQASVVKQGLVNAKSESYLLRERSADGVIRGWGESEE